MAKVEDPQAQYGFQEPKKERISLETYLDMIADGTRRLEYHDGVVVDIKSATEAHGTIIMNLSIFIGTCLLDKDCKLFAQDRELWIPRCNKVYYPDLMLICGDHRKIELSKNVQATLNPLVVIEVLSDSTEKYDLFTKSKCYKTIDDLEQIIYVRQDVKYIMVQKKVKDATKWAIEDFTEDEDEIQIGDCKILLKDIYRKVELEDIPESMSDL